MHINRAITLLPQKLSGFIFRVNLSKINIRLVESLYITVFRFKISPHFSRSLQEVTQEFFTNRCLPEFLSRNERY